MVNYDMLAEEEKSNQRTELKILVDPSFLVGTITHSPWYYLGSGTLVGVLRIKKIRRINSQPFQPQYFYNQSQGTIFQFPGRTTRVQYSVIFCCKLCDTFLNLHETLIIDSDLSATNLVLQLRNSEPGPGSRKDTFLRDLLIDLRDGGHQQYISPGSRMSLGILGGCHYLTNFFMVDKLFSDDLYLLPTPHQLGRQLLSKVTVCETICETQAHHGFREAVDGLVFFIESLDKLPCSLIRSLKDSQEVNGMFDVVNACGEFSQEQLFYLRKT
ncbi:hypothetical protein PIB30_095379 [Stylosanthes scabra]|uniref:Uncharacterized protein n=1 Tax=Stylosanthes scabra TaxID=79078 RepID=A0ABU6WYS9_9FABA|nr:hypothetical protein [Stylosanthes scabra]